METRTVVLTVRGLFLIAFVAVSCDGAADETTPLTMTGPPVTEASADPSIESQGTNSITMPASSAPHSPRPDRQSETSGAPTFVALQGDSVVFADTDGASILTVALPAGTPSFERLLVHSDDAAAYVAEGGMLYVVPRQAQREIMTLGRFSSVGPVSDDGFWRSVADGGLDEVTWRFESFDGAVGPAIELRVTQSPFGELADGLAVWDRETSEVLYVTPRRRAVLSTGVPLTSARNSVMVLVDGVVSQVDADGRTRPVLDLGDAVPSSTLEATAVSPNQEQLAILRKDPTSYSVLDLTIVDLATGAESVLPINEGARVAWISDTAVLVYADRPFPVIVNLEDSSLTPIDLASDQVIAEIIG